MMDSMEPQLLRINMFEKTDNILNINNNYSDRYIYSVLESRPAVDVQNIEFGYKKNVPILNKLSIKIPRGRIFGLLGSSGCGKTTLLRLVLGRLQPKKGSIKVFGIRPASSKSNIPGSGVGYMPQETALFKEFTISETLYYFGILYDMDLTKIEERIGHLKDLLNLPEKDRLVCELSGGQQRLVSMAVTMIHKPPLLILDEPTVGVDSVLRCRIWEYLEQICKIDGTTVVITTHYLEEANSASNVAYIQSGTLLVQSNPKTLLTKNQCQTLEEVFLKLSIERHNCPKDEPMEPIKQNQSTEQNSFINNLCSDQKKIINVKHIRAMLWRSQIRIVRNPLILIMLLLLPVIQISLFCLCTGGKPNNIPIAILEPDFENHLSHSFLDHMDNKLIQKHYYTDKDKAIESVRSGRSYFAVMFSSNFTDSLETRVHSPLDLDEEDLNHSSITLVADMTNSAVGPHIHHSLIESTQKFLKKYVSSLGLNPNTFSIPLEVKQPIYGNLDYSVFDYTAPGIIIATIHVTTMLFSSLLIVIERKDGHLDRALVAGVNSSEILISHIIMLFVCVLAKTVLMMIFSFILFDIPLRGSVLDAFTIILLQGLQGMSFGLFISIISPAEFIALILDFSIVFPLWFFCAVFWPIEAVPKYFQPITYAAPLTLPIDALRSVLLRSWTLYNEQVFYGCAMSLTYILILLFLSFVLFRKSTH